MAQVLEAEVASQVGSVAKSMGYKVTRYPTHVPRQSHWKNSLESLIRTRRYRPDLLVENAKSSVIVEVKSRPVLLGGITQATKYKEYFNAAVILCIPDDCFQKTPESVRKYAVQQEVYLCSVSGIAQVLGKLLGSKVMTSSKGDTGT